MPDTSLGITYPASTGHTRLWEWLQEMADDVNGIFVRRNPLYGRGKLSAPQALTNTVTDLAGCSVTINVPTPQAVAWVQMAMDCTLITAGTASTLAVLNAMVDGVVQADPQPVWGPGNWAAQANARGTVGAGFPVLLSGSGNHVIKAQAAKPSTGAITAAANHTYVSVLALPF